MHVQLWLDWLIVRGEEASSTTTTTKRIIFCKSNMHQVFDAVCSNVTFPSVPILAVLIRGALIVTGEPAWATPESAGLRSFERFKAGCMSATSLTFSDVNTSRILDARVCSRIVVGP